MRASPIQPTVDFNADGEQHGFLKLPHSHDGSAWGAVMIPVTVIRRGEGPTVLLTGGNHNDRARRPRNFTAGPPSPATTSPRRTTVSP